MRRRLLRGYVLHVPVAVYDHDAAPLRNGNWEIEPECNVGGDGENLARIGLRVVDLRKLGEVTLLAEPPGDMIAPEHALANDHLLADHVNLTGAVDDRETV